MKEEHETEETNKGGPYGHPVIFAAQVASLGMIWIFLFGIALWMANLIQVSMRWNDAIGATMGIGLFAVPVFATLAGVLTYVFVGLHKENRRLLESSTEE